MLNYTTNGLDKFRADPRFSSITGKGYTVVVIDTGIDLKNTHPIFGGDKNNNGFADRVEIAVNDDFWRDERSRAWTLPSSNQDTQGHGTRVASTILGVAPDVNIIGAKSLISGINDRIINWSVANKNKYNIVGINLSQVVLNNTMDNFQNPPNPGSLFNYQSLKTASNVGIIPVAAGGNFYQAHGSRPGLSTPAAYHFTLGAMHSNSNATTRPGTDLRPTAQRRNDAIAAPGELVPTVTIGSKQTWTSGSSIATPFITGSVALLQGVAEKYLGRKLTFKELETVIQKTADPLGVSGYKEIDIYESAEAIWRKDLSPDTPKPILNTTSVTFNNNVSRYNFWGTSSLTLLPTDGVVAKDSLISFSKNFSGVKAVIGNPFTVKPNTILSFEYKGNSRIKDEITGIGFDTNHVLWDNLTQPNKKGPFFSIESSNTTWNKNLIDEYQYTGINTWQKFNIPVGEYFTGTFNHLTFLNGQGTAEFKNIQLHNL